MRVAVGIKSLVNDRDLQLESTRFLHETLLVLVLMYGSEKMGCIDGQPQRFARY